MGVVNVALLEVLVARELVGVGARDLELLLLFVEEVHNVKAAVPREVVVDVLLEGGRRSLGRATQRGLKLTLGDKIRKRFTKYSKKREEIHIRAKEGLNVRKERKEEDLGELLVPEDGDGAARLHEGEGVTLGHNDL